MSSLPRFEKRIQNLVESSWMDGRLNSSSFTEKSFKESENRFKMDDDWNLLFLP